jgi:hypothetical protein
MSRRLVALAFAAVLPLAAPAPAHALSQNCDQCADLPRLYRELLEQEFLRNKFNSWIREAYYPVSIEAMQASAAKALDTAANGNLYGDLGRPQTVGGQGVASAAPAFGTDTSTKDCRLVEYVKDKDGKTTQRPVTPQQVRAKLCKPLADYTLAHEGQHQKTCRAGKLNTVEEFALDDRDAYQAGVAVLRAHIADLARKCSWRGSVNERDKSVNERKPDGTDVVPTPKEIASLKDATKTKAALLGRGKR